MKAKFYFSVITALFLTASIFQSCGYDDTDLVNRVSKTEEEIASLKERMDRYIESINDEIEAVKEIVKGGIIQSINQEDKSGKASIITFYGGKTIRIYNGIDGETGATGEKGDIGATGATGRINLGVIMGSDPKLEFGTVSKEKIDQYTLYWTIDNVVLSFNGVPIPVASKPVEAITDQNGNLVWAVGGVALTDNKNLNIPVHGTLSITEYNGEYYWSYDGKILSDENNHNIKAYPTIKVSNDGKLLAYYNDDIVVDLSYNIKERIETEITANIERKGIVTLFNTDANSATFRIYNSDLRKYIEYTLSLYHKESYFDNIYKKTVYGGTDEVYVGELNFTYYLNTDTQNDNVIYVTYENVNNGVKNLILYNSNPSGFFGKYIGKDINNVNGMITIDHKKSEQDYFTINLKFKYDNVVNSIGVVKVNVYDSNRYETKSVSIQIVGVAKEEI
jgi:hypothetical protein